MQPTESHPERPQVPQPEIGSTNLERTPQAPSEATPVEPPQTSHNVAPLQSVPQPAPVADPSASDDAPTTTSPTQAGDGDEIEATWVQQADTIKEKYQDDPFTEEEAAEALSQDYLQKRFGIDVDKT